MLWSFAMGKWERRHALEKGEAVNFLEDVLVTAILNCDCQSGELLVHFSLFCEMFVNSSALSFTQLRNH